MSSRTAPIEYFLTGPTPCVSKQPAVVQLDGRAAIADLHELPRILGLKNGSTAVPCVKIVGIDQIKILVVLPADHRIAAVDLSREQSHALVARRRSAERRHPERSEIRGCEQLGANRPAAIGGIGRIERLSSVVVEFDEARVLDAVGLGVGDRKDDPLAQVFVGPEDHFDIIAVGRWRPASNLGDGREARGRIDGDAAVRSDGAGPERQR